MRCTLFSTADNYLNNVTSVAMSLGESSYAVISNNVIDITGGGISLFDDSDDNLVYNNTVSKTTTS